MCVVWVLRSTSWSITCFDLLVGTEPLVTDVTEVTSWRERAEAAEQRLAEAEERIEKMVEQVAVLSRMLFGPSSEKGSGGVGESGGQAEAHSGEADGDRPKRGQRPGSKGRFTAGFCARLLYLKFVLGLPVHRIVKILATEGLAVSEGTVARALKALAGLLEPVERAIRARNTAATQGHADETTWQVYQQVESKSGHRWWLWVFIAEDTVVFRMDTTRSNAVLDTQFQITAADRQAGALPDGRQLALSSDFYTVYQSLARMDGVEALWCWAHMRRYFIRAGDAHPYLRAWQDSWVARIADLYVTHTAMAAAQVATPEYAAAERHSLEPLTYLTDYLTACAQTGGKPLNGETLDPFLPWLPGPTGSRDHDPPTINPMIRAPSPTTCCGTQDQQIGHTGTPHTGSPNSHVTGDAFSLAHPLILDGET
jgi:Transposase IS66 family